MNNQQVLSFVALVLPLIGMQNPLPSMAPLVVVVVVQLIVRTFCVVVV